MFEVGIGYGLTVHVRLTDNAAVDIDSARGSGGAKRTDIMHNAGMVEKNTTDIWCTPPKIASDGVTLAIYASGRTPDSL
jgi:hypothetical protein